LISGGFREVVSKGPPHSGKKDLRMEKFEAKGLRFYL
jgi:hypothetical protein